MFFAAPTSELPPLPAHIELQRDCVLGRGNYGVVYAARDASRNGARVAVKEVVAKTRKVFCAETRVAALLPAGFEHPHLVAVYGAYSASPAAAASLSFTTPFCGYLVMERCCSSTLDACLRQHGAMSTTEADDVLRALVSALGALHGAGVAHRDVKPANVSYNRDARVAKLMDFGFAAPLVEGGSCGQSDRANGTPMYMAPELFYRPGVNLGACDTWALGQTLYTMLVGRPYYAACRTEVELRAAHFEPLRLPPALSAMHTALLTHMLDKRAFERPTMATAARTLEQTFHTTAGARD